MTKYAKCQHCNEPIALVPNSWAVIGRGPQEYWSHCTTGYGDCTMPPFNTGENYAEPLAGSESDSYDDVA